MTDGEGKLARLRLRLSQLDIQAVPLAGRKHQAADASLSLPTARADGSLVKEGVPVSTIINTLLEWGKTETNETFGTVSMVLMEWTPKNLDCQKPLQV